MAWVYRAWTFPEVTHMADVGIRNLAKSFGGTTILDGVTFDIEDGEFVALVGPSGCGKSTLLRLVAGLEGVTAGEILIGGRVINRMAPRERDIAMVFQNYALYPHMTVAENMGFALRLQKVTPADIAHRVTRAAEILGLGALMTRYPKQLSGGQRQRVAMGRAIVRDPKVFLFDEPLSNLDAKLRVQMRAEIKQLHQRLGTTTIYVTHDQIEALTMADKVVVMNGGRIEQMGPPLELYDRPATRFVAGFIGSPAMNFLSGTITAPGEFRTETGATLAIPPVGASHAGRAVTLGFRPEHAEIAEAGLPVRVAVAEPTGAETFIIGQIGGADVTLSFRERLAPAPGTVISVRIPPGRLHLFDAASGQSLRRPEPAEGASP